MYSNQKFAGERSAFRRKEIAYKNGRGGNALKVNVFSVLTPVEVGGSGKGRKIAYKTGKKGLKDASFWVINSPIPAVGGREKGKLQRRKRP